MRQRDQAARQHGGIALHAIDQRQRLAHRRAAGDEQLAPQHARFPPAAVAGAVAKAEKDRQREANSENGTKLSGTLQRQAWPCTSVTSTAKPSAASSCGRICGRIEPRQANSRRSQTIMRVNEARV